MNHQGSRTNGETSRLSQLAGAARTGLAGLLTAVFALGLAGCGDDAPMGPGGGGASSAVVAGSVQETSGSASRIASATTAAPGPASATSDATSSASAATAAVASVNASGDLETMAEADVQADGTFRIEDVPAGRSGLVVVARSDEGAEVGRVLVHGETRAGAVTTVSPITLETTVEGHLYSELRADGEDEAADNSGALALFVRMDDETAASVLSSSGSIDALASAYAAGQATLSSTFAEVGSDLDAAARADAMTRVATDYAQARDGGMSVQAANDAFAAAALDALVDAGADLETTSEALAGYATAATAETAGTVVSSDAHLALTKQLVSLDLRARERLASDQSGSFDGSTAEETASALATARADVEAAVSLTEVEAALQAAADDSKQLVFDGVLGLLGDVSLTLQSEVESELEAAFAEADLAADLEGSATSSGIAGIVAAYRSDVDAASDTVIATMPDSVSLDAEATSRILVASNGDAMIHH